MGLTCFSNGSLARERVRDAYGLTWAEFSRALEDTPPGNEGRIMLPWFEPEITPSVTRPGVRRFGLSIDDAPGNVRAVVEAQQMAMALHSRWMSVPIDTIHATGGAAANVEILQIMADVFGADVQRFDVRNSAALGAALRALHGERLDAGRAALLGRRCRRRCSASRGNADQAGRSPARDVSIAHARRTRRVRRRRSVATPSRTRVCDSERSVPRANKQPPPG